MRKVTLTHTLSQLSVAAFSWVWSLGSSCVGQAQMGRLWGPPVWKITTAGWSRAGVLVLTSQSLGEAVLGFLDAL